MTTTRPGERAISFGETFLRDPDLFPGRRSGEAWGGQGIAFEIAGSRYVFSGLDPSQLQVLGARFGSLLLEGGGHGIDTLVFHVDARDFHELERARPYSFDLDYRPDSVHLAGPHFMARLDWAPGLRGALWTSARGPSFQGVFENYFRVLLGYRLLEGGGSLVHSAAVRDARGAYLVFGPSGAGKSTFARLAREAGGAVLSDDLNPLCVGENTTVVETVPFYGDLAPDPAPPGVPLRAICRLRKAETDSLQALELGECLASLIASAPFASRDPYRAAQLMQNLEALARPVPAYELRFSRTGRAFDLLRAAAEW